MFDTPLRQFKDQVATPVAKRMRRVPPLLMSICSLIAGLFSAYAAYQNLYLLAFGLWLLNRALDGLDGLIARLHNGQTDIGGYIDSLIDYTIYAALPIGLVTGSATEAHFYAVIFMLASFYINSASWMYLAAILEKRTARDPNTQTTIIMPAGLIGGFETFIAYCLFTLFPTYLILQFYIFGALVFVTIIQRLVWAWKNIK
jgi:phosphatidylglycerophosphate synthase